MLETMLEPHATEWRAFRQRLLGYVRRRVNDPADAEDLVQDILARASGRLNTLHAGDRLVPWLDALTRNALVDFYRRKGRSPARVPLEAIPVEPATVEEPEGDRQRAALGACVRPMVGALPDRYREVLVRVDLNGERQVDVAEDLGVGVSTLKSRVQRGRALLRDAFTDCCTFDRDAAGRVVNFTPRR